MLVGGSGQAIYAVHFLNGSGSVHWREVLYEPHPVP
jgi:hypothetical protein